MKILLTGGGTGGHVSPALGIASEIMARSAENELLFIGRRGGAENKAVEKMGIQLRELEVYGIKRSLSLSNLKRIFCAIKAIKEAKRIILDFSPDAVLGTGGYVCWPVLKAAKRLGIPTLIHESNEAPGLVTKLLSKKCNAVLVNCKTTARYLKGAKRIETVGNPINPRFYAANKAMARHRLGIGSGNVLILSFGGSGGADIINRSAKELMRDYVAKENGVKHIHATGRAYFDEWVKDFDTPKNCRVMPYIENMPEYLSAADIVISRCGAMTLSELCAAGACSILIPSPNVTGDHQKKNALGFEEQGAAIMIEEKDLAKGALIKTVDELVKNKERRLELSRRIGRKRTPDAARKTVDIIEELVGK